MDGSGTARPFRRGDATCLTLPITCCLHFGNAHGFEDGYQQIDQPLTSFVKKGSTALLTSEQKLAGWQIKSVELRAGGLHDSGWFFDGMTVSA
jgi:hypothetical protein